MSTGDQRPPVVGTLAEYSEAPFERRWEWSDGEDVVTMTGPEENHHLVVHPDYVRRVLLEDDDQYVKYGAYDSVFGNGLVNVYGEEWRAQRGAMQPAFTPDRVISYCETIQDVVRPAVEARSDGEVVDVRELMTDLTMEVMLETLFGGTTDEEGAIGRAAERINEWFMESATAGSVPESVESNFDQGLAEMTELIEGMIEDRDGDADSEDLLSMLVAMGPDHEASYTDERIRDEMITLLFAAHETTALTLAYTLYLLADAPDVVDRLQTELDDVLDGAFPGPEHVRELSYTEQVIDEAMRIYSPAHSLFREATADVEIGPYEIPEGDVVYLPQCVIHRDDRWWDDPETFRPERFAGDDDRHPFAYFPFGAGPRRCIGERFARAEAKLVVAAFADAFTFDRVTEEFEMLASLTAVPDRPLELRFRDRA
ncbi:cytochrome P450 [Halobaculum sp. MBLA0147]|uniref:cytochrome P450 n=1 Tax=Halobaculum sp. MBLA0147 TaxID=3079934 RepID=UPI0035261433